MVDVSDKSRRRQASVFRVGEGAVRGHGQICLALESCLEPDPFRAGFRAVRTLLPADGDGLKVSRRRSRASAMSDAGCKCDRIWTCPGDKSMEGSLRLGQSPVRNSLDWTGLVMLGSPSLRDGRTIP